MYKSGELFEAKVVRTSDVVDLSVEVDGYEVDVVLLKEDHKR